MSKSIFSLFLFALGVALALSAPPQVAAQVGPATSCDNIVPDQKNHFDLTSLRAVYVISRFIFYLLSLGSSVQAISAFAVTLFAHNQPESLIFDLNITSISICIGFIALFIIKYDFGTKKFKISSSTHFKTHKLSICLTRI